MTDKTFKIFYSLDINNRTVSLPFNADSPSEALDKAQNLSEEENRKKFLEYYKDDEEFLWDLLESVSLSVNTYYEPEEHPLEAEYEYKHIS
ncbi:hypothetical protein [Geminocystis sp. NIES-3709]|uniref:hypothetical protein n=1 Tax=Geminocystis sp. NIES-3709 TaxID=1617448 RepID=UPI0008261C5D|nr:hypothetical protein [Geminocystis sp. NIES-3709]